MEFNFHSMKLILAKPELDHRKFFKELTSRDSYLLYQKKISSVLAVLDIDPVNCEEA